MLCCSAGRVAFTQSQCPCRARTAITSRLLCLFATAVVLLSVAEGHVYFGYYGANNSATPWATIYQAATIADAQSSWDLHNIPSLLSVYDVFLTSTATSPLVLRPDFGARWSVFADAAQPLLLKGVLLGFNLGDELVRAARNDVVHPGPHLTPLQMWNCLSASNLSTMSDAVRTRCPRGSCIAWYNEAAFFGQSGPSRNSCGQEVVPARPYCCRRAVVTQCGRSRCPYRRL